MWKWATRHPIFIWSVAWGVVGLACFAGDVFSTPRGPRNALPLAWGVVCWAIAGAATFHRNAVPTAIAIWAGGYIVSLWLGAVFGDAFEHGSVASVQSIGFVGTLLGWALGASLAAVASGVLATPRHGGFVLLALAAAWGLSFLLGGYLAVVAGYVGGEVSKGVVSIPGSSPLRVAIGWGIGGACGGLVAATLAVGVTRYIEA